MDVMKMGSVYKISKVTPVELPPAKQNNFTVTNRNIIHQLKYLICVETLLGINRLYLLHQNKILLWLSNAYVVIIASMCTYYAVNVQTTGASHLVIIDSICLEYILLVLTALFSKKDNFNKLFRDLSTFDDILCINKDIDAINVANRGTFWIIASGLYNLLEYLLIFSFSSPAPQLEFIILLFYMMSLSHDSEQIFFFTLLRTIYMRAVIVKTHVCSVFPLNERKKNIKKKLNKVEALSKNTELDIGSLHKVYELLHKCSDQLNSIMSLPVLMLFKHMLNQQMLITLFTSGLSTTILLKVLVAIVQTDNNLEPGIATSIVIFLLVRCVKYTLLVIVPCYYSSITASQVATIRNTLHDAVNTMELDKHERRKVKAFFLLTKENEFAYAVCRVIRLNMTLPLSYTSLCATYLVIIIQFSKFID